MLDRPDPRCLAQVAVYLRIFCFLCFISLEYAILVKDLEYFRYSSASKGAHLLKLPACLALVKGRFCTCADATPRHKCRSVLRLFPLDL